MPDLDPILASWRSDLRAIIESLSDDDMLARAKGMSSTERVQTWDRYRTLKQALGPSEKLSIKEIRWILTLLSTDRAEAVKTRASGTKAAKAATATVPTDLDSLL